PSLQPPANIVPRLLKLMQRTGPSLTDEERSKRNTRRGTQPVERANSSSKRRRGEEVEEEEQLSSEDSSNEGSGIQS
ncbi:2113_t:CDS:2, partial [Acaulospora morrowiae]